ncbi:hypothetical protein [Candidatus Cryosericum odellii]|jgi:hypothetical protein|uniref:hypothetical protein n=1 Tax=Candidatus Cryosericum odellii TaxID=2290917 RepID=UPI000F86A424|nr:hypothetical protein [Candidatus Cryosericum odellii]
MPSQDRKQIFIFGTTSAYREDIVCIIVGLILVPIWLYYFGLIRYGVWTVISSVIAYLNLSNLGIKSATPVLIGKASKLFEQQAVLLRSLFLFCIGGEFELFVKRGLYSDR